MAFISQMLADLPILDSNNPWNRVKHDCLVGKVLCLPYLSVFYRHLSPARPTAFTRPPLFGMALFPGVLGAPRLWFTVLLYSHHFPPRN